MFSHSKQHPAVEQGKELPIGSVGCSLMFVLNVFSVNRQTERKAALDFETHFHFLTMYTFLRAKHLKLPVKW